MLRKIANDFYMNQNCGECILRAANKAYDLGLDERALKLASGFGAGMGCGNTCGALSAAMSVLSLLFCGDRPMKQKASRNSVQNMLTLSRLPSAVTTVRN